MSSDNKFEDPYNISSEEAVGSLEVENTDTIQAESPVGAEKPVEAKKGPPGAAEVVVCSRLTCLPEVGRKCTKEVCQWSAGECTKEVCQWSAGGCTKEVCQWSAGGLPEVCQVREH